MQEYKQEVKQVIPDIYHEHATLLKDAQNGLFVKTFTTLGKLLSGDISFINYQELSPISHYNDKGYIKSRKKFKEELEDDLETVYARHESMIYHDNAAYLELAGNHMAKTVISFIDSVNLSPESLSDVQESFLNLGNIVFYSIAATSYVIGGICALGLNIATFFYTVGQCIGSNLLDPLQNPIAIQYNPTIIEVLLLGTSNLLEVPMCHKELFV